MRWLLLMILGWMMCTTKVKGWCTTDFTDPNKMGKLEGLVATWNERPDGKWDIKVRFRAKAHHICRSGKSSLQSGDNALRDPHILVALTKERLGMGLHSSASDTKTFYIHTPSSAENPPENNKCPFYEKLTGKTDWEGLKYYEKTYTISSAEAGNFDTSWFGNTMVTVGVAEQYRTRQLDERSWQKGDICGGHFAFQKGKRSSGSRKHNYFKKGDDNTCQMTRTSTSETTHSDSESCKANFDYSLNAHTFLQPQYYCVKNSNKPGLNGNYKFDSAQTFSYDTTAKRKVIYKKANCEQDASGSGSSCSLGLEELDEPSTYAPLEESKRTYSSTYAATYAESRLDASSYWSTKDGTANRKTEWLKFDVGFLTAVEGITTRGGTDYYCWVKTYKLQYSKDGTVWTDVDNGKDFAGNTDKSTLVTNDFDAPVSARYLKVIPQTFESGYVCMKADLKFADPGNVTRLVIKGAGTYPCFRERTLVASEGTGTGTSISGKEGILGQCQRECLNNANCNSFAYCNWDNYGCWYKTKVITLDDAPSTNYNANFRRRCKTYYKPSTSCTGSGPATHHEKLIVHSTTKVNTYGSESTSGEWGGVCTCPDGNEYFVGDDGNSCGSLTAKGCIGGYASVCHRIDDAMWKNKKVTCGSLPADLNHRLSDLTSEAVMTSAGWSFTGNTDLMPSRSNYRSGNKNPGANSPITMYGFNSGGGTGSVSATLQGSGTATLEFGNSWNDGTVKVYLNDVKIDEAGVGTHNRVKTFSFSNNDVLKIETGDGIWKLYSFKTTTLSPSPSTASYFDMSSAAARPENVEISMGTCADPAWSNTFPKVEPIDGEGTKLKLSVKLENSEAKVYYVVVDKTVDNTPSSTEVKAGQGKGGQSAKASGYIETSTPAKVYTAEADGLTDGTEYDVFFMSTNWVTETDVGSVEKLSQTTTDGTPPMFSSGYPGTKSVTFYGFQAKVKLNEAGSCSFVVVPYVAGTDHYPSATQVFDGKKKDGGSPVMSGSISVTADSEALSQSFDDDTVFSHGTQYNVFFACVDAANNEQASIEAIQFTTDIDPDPPKFTNPYPALSIPKLYEIQMDILADEPCDIYFWCIKSSEGQSPAAAEVVAKGGSAADHWGNFHYDGGSNSSNSAITRLDDDTSYDVFFVAKDSRTNTQTSPTKKNVTSKKDTTAPMFKEAIPKTSARTVDSVSVSIISSELGFVHAICVSEFDENAANAPTPADVAAGKKGDGIAVASERYAKIALTHSACEGDKSNGCAVVAFDGLDDDVWYYVYVALEDNAKTPVLSAQAKQVIQKTTKDTTPPSYSATTSGKGSSGFTVNIDLGGEAGKCYFVLSLKTGSSDPGTPNNSQVRNGKDSDGNSVEESSLTGSFDVVASASATAHTITGLSEGNSYRLSIACEDTSSSNNLGSTWTKMETVEADTTPPTFANLYPKSNVYMTSSIVARTKLSEDGLTYFAVLPAGSTAPTLDQMKGLNNDPPGTVPGALSTGKVVTLAGREGVVLLKNLQPSSDYKFYAIAFDQAAIPNPGNLFTSGNQTTLPACEADSCFTCISVSGSSDIATDGIYDKQNSTRWSHQDSPNAAVSKGSNGAWSIQNAGTVVGRKSSASATAASTMPPQGEWEIPEGLASEVTGGPTVTPCAAIPGKATANLTASLTEAKTFVARWNLPEDTGGAALKKITVEIKQICKGTAFLAQDCASPCVWEPEGKIAWEDCCVRQNATFSQSFEDFSERSVSVTGGIEAGKKYIISTYAWNAVGQGEAYELPEGIMALGRPSQLSINDGIIAEQGSATLVFEKHSGNSGSAISTYTIYARNCPQNSNECDSGTLAVHLFSVSNALVNDGGNLVVNNLTNGVRYEFTAIATNQAGFVSAPSEKRYAKPVGKPTLPLDSLVLPGDGQATVAWKPPVDDGGSPLKKYAIVPRNGNGTDWAQLGYCPYSSSTAGRCTMEVSADVSSGIDRILVLPDEVTAVVYLKLALPSPHRIAVGSSFIIDGTLVPTVLQSESSFIVSEVVSPTQLQFQLTQTASQTFIGSWKLKLRSYRVDFLGLTNNVPYGFAVSAMNANFEGDFWYKDKSKPILPLSSNTKLSSLVLGDGNGTDFTMKSLSSGEMVSFEPTTRGYLVFITSSQTFVDIAFQTEDAGARTEVKGSGSGFINETALQLPENTKRVSVDTGINFVNVDVVAANKDTGQYRLRIERAGPPTWKTVNENQEEISIVPTKVIATDTKIMLSWTDAVDNNSPIEEYEVYMYPNYTVHNVHNVSTSSAKDPCLYNTTCLTDTNGRQFCKQIPLILRSAAATSLELVGCLSAALDETFNGYFFRIRARNSEGWSDLSDSNKDGFFVAAEKPDAPIPLESRIQPFQIIIRWLEVSFTNANGARVTDYRVIRCDQFQSCSTFLNSEGDFSDEGSSFEFKDSNLFAATQYTYTLAAKNLIGWSDTQTIKATTSPTTPSAVQSVTADTPVLNGTTFDVQYSWTGPQYRNGFDIEKYKFELYDLSKSSSGGCPSLNQFINTPVYEEIVAVDPNSDKGSQGTVKYDLAYIGAKPAKIYCALVYAFNELGYSDAALSRDSFATGPAPPEAICPNNVTELQGILPSDRDRRSQLKFAWGAPIDNANTITNYSISVLWENDAGVWLTAENVLIKDTVLNNVTGAIPRNEEAHIMNSHLSAATFLGDRFYIQGGQSYSIDIRASNAVGKSSSCRKLLNDETVRIQYFTTTTKPPGKPDEISDFEITSAAGTSANMSWSVPYDGDAAIASYLLTETVQKCGPESSRCIVGDKKEHTIADTNIVGIDVTIGARLFYAQWSLRANTEYNFTLQATNVVGISDSGGSKIVTTADPLNPGVVERFVNTSTGKTFIRVQWEYPQSDGGADVKKYEVTLYKQGNQATEDSVLVQSFVLHDNAVESVTSHGHIFSRQGTDFVNGHTLSLEKLEGSTLYRIHVLACNRGDGSDDKCGREFGVLKAKTGDACLPGEYMIKTDNAEVCEKCTAGTFSAKKSVLTSCTNCPTGKSQAKAGQSACTDCPKGKSTNGESRSAKCTDCSSGSFSALDGSETCSVCPKGSFQSLAGRTSCSHCELSTFNDLEGMKKRDDCIKCADNAVTYEEGAVKRSECLCMGGYYTKDDAVQSDDQKVLWVPCVKCVKGAVCASNKYGHVMDADVGFWTPNQTTTHPTKRFYRCPLDGCLGGDHTVGGAKSRCAYGYTGIACARCIDGMFKKGYKCEPCEASSLLPFFILVLTFVGAISLSVWAFRHFIHSRRMRKYSVLYRDVSNIAAIMLSFAQILEGTVGVYSGVEWPDLFSNFWKILNIAGLDFVSMSGISCAAKVDFYLSFLGQMCIPLCVSGYLGLYFLFESTKIHVKQKAILLTVKNPVKKMQLKVKTAMKIEKLQGRTKRWVVKILILIHTPIARKWMQFNDCTFIEGVPYLKADYSVICYDERWQAFSVPMVLVGIIYIIGLPLGLLYLLVRNRKRLDHPEVLDSIGFLYTPYRRAAYFWEIEEIFRKMLLSGGLILLGDYPAFQLFVAVVAAILFHQIHALWKPHYNPLAYRLQHVALCAIEVVYLVGLLLLLKEPVPEGVLFGASGGTVAMGIIMLGMATYITFTKFIKLRKEDAALEKDYEFQERLKSELRDHNLANNFRQEEEAERSSTKVNPVLEKDSSESSKVVKVSLPEVEKEKKTTAHDKFAKFLAEEGDTEEKAQKESDSKPNEMYMI